MKLFGRKKKRDDELDDQFDDDDVQIDIMTDFHEAVEEVDLSEDHFDTEEKEKTSLKQRISNKTTGFSLFSRKKKAELDDRFEDDDVQIDITNDTYDKQDDVDLSEDHFDTEETEKTSHKKRISKKNAGFSLFSRKKKEEPDEQFEDDDVTADLTNNTFDTQDEVDFSHDHFDREEDEKPPLMKRMLAKIIGVTLTAATVGALVFGFTWYQGKKQENFQNQVKAHEIQKCGNDRACTAALNARFDGCIEGATLSRKQAIVDNVFSLRQNQFDSCIGYSDNVVASSNALFDTQPSMQAATTQASSQPKQLNCLNLEKRKLKYIEARKVLEACEPYAKAGNLKAQEIMGLTEWDYGDSDTAVKWFKAAELNGSKNVQVYLGLAYNDGIGVESDFEIATLYIKIADYSTESSALSTLAVNYQMNFFNKLDVTSNYKNKAIALYERCSAMGDYECSETLSGIYQGNGDSVKALAWMKLTNKRLKVANMHYNYDEEIRALEQNLSNDQTQVAKGLYNSIQSASID